MIGYGVKTVNLEKLASEMKAAGLSGPCWESGFKPDSSLLAGGEIPSDLRASAEAVIAAHDPTPVPLPRDEAKARLREYRTKPVTTPADDRAALRDILDLIL